MKLVMKNQFWKTGEKTLARWCTVEEKEWSNFRTRIQDPKVQLKVEVPEEAFVMRKWNIQRDFENC